MKTEHQRHFGMRRVSGSGVLIGTRLVSKCDYAVFLRTGAYFERDHWGETEPTARGGDELLERIGYDYRNLNEPVTGLNWFEADAFCTWLGGRLPYVDEWCDWQGIRFEALRSTRSAYTGEWFRDWYSRQPSVRGPRVKPRPPNARRVLDTQLERAAPEESLNVGFRLVDAGGGRHVD